MYKITAKEKIAPGVFAMKVEAPKIARKAQPGHFIILRLHELGERIPLTIVSTTDKGEVEVIFQVMGKSTAHLATFEIGELLPTFLGPLGVVPEVPEEPGTVLCIAGGVGAAPILPRAIDLYRRGWKVITILGARTRELLILKDRLGRASSELFICTDDGSQGHKGFVTDLIPEIAKKTKISEVLAIGPVPMMAAVTRVTKELQLPTTVSLNALMVDGTGMCGACRVNVGGETKFTCIDGPEFDGHLVDFPGLQKRLGQYLEQEKEAKERYEQKRGECQCLKG